MRINIYTILGLLSVLFWSTTFGFARILIENLGLFTTITSIYLTSGILSCLFVFSKKKNQEKLFSINKKYLIICGALFVIYSITVYSSVGLVFTRQQVIEVGLNTNDLKSVETAEKVLQNTYFNAAVRALSEQKMEEAEEALKLTIDYGNESVDAFYQLGKIYNTKKQFNEAVSAIRNLPESEWGKTFKLWISIFSVADRRRRKTECIGGCAHEWHNI